MSNMKYQVSDDLAVCSVGKSRLEKCHGIVIAISGPVVFRIVGDISYLTVSTKHKIKSLKKDINIIKQMLKRANVNASI